MHSADWILIAIAILSLSGLPGLFGSPRGPLGQRLAAAALIIGSLAGWVGIGLHLSSGAVDGWSTPWFLPVGEFAVRVDALSTVFLAPVFTLPALAAVFGLGYWKQTEHPGNGRKLTLFWGLLAGAMALVLIAADSILFLIAWECMALAGYFAMTTEDHDPTVCRAGWIYLVYTHLGTLCLVAMFVLWLTLNGNSAIAPPRLALSAPAANATFVLALIGFGCKAGLMPLHSWVPGGDAAAPCHVAAIKSGVMQKMGIYGILRITCGLEAPPGWWGGTLIAVGIASGILGLAFAIGQRDLKRLLAYSSIENLGIITAGLGLALLGRSCGQPVWVMLGLGGALLHVWNHGLFKSLLFLGTGAIGQATGTHDLDKLGGLAKSMPRTATWFFIGVLAICALPPLNGFPGEWLLYLGLFHTLADPPMAASLSPGAWGSASVAAVGLAIVGGLAVVCFVRLFGSVFLGRPRLPAPMTAPCDPGPLMTGSLAVAGVGCLAGGLAPWLAAPWLERATGVWWPAAARTPLLPLAPLHWLTAMGLALAGGLGLVGWLIYRGLRHPAVVFGPTWGCGYAAPTARMQYTASSFGRSLVDLFGWALWPRAIRPRIRRLFAGPERVETEVPDTVLERLVLPVFRLADRFLPWLRLTQQGLIQVYMAYFLAVLLVLFVWASLGGIL